MKGGDGMEGRNTKDKGVRSGWRGRKRKEEKIERNIGKVENREFG